MCKPSNIAFRKRWGDLVIVILVNRHISMRHFDKDSEIYPCEEACVNVSINIDCDDYNKRVIFSRFFPSVIGLQCIANILKRYITMLETFSSPALEPHASRHDGGSI